MIVLVFCSAFSVFTSATTATPVSYYTADVSTRQSSTIVHVVPVFVESIVNNRIWFSPVTLRSMTTAKKESDISTCKFNNRKTVFSDLHGQDSTTHKNDYFITARHLTTSSQPHRITYDEYVNEGNDDKILPPSARWTSENYHRLAVMEEHVDDTSTTVDINKTAVIVTPNEKL